MSDSILCCTVIVVMAMSRQHRAVAYRPLIELVVIHPTNDLSQNFTYVSREYFYYKTMSSETCCLNIFSGGSSQTPSTSFCLVADRSFATSKPVHTCYTMNANIYCQVRPWDEIRHCLCATVVVDAFP